MDRPRNGSDRELRELLTYLRDTFQDSARRIDDYLARADGTSRGEPRPEPRRERTWRDDREAHGSRDAHGPRDARPSPAERGASSGGGDAPGAGFVHDSLEKLREEVRWISQEAPSMDAPLLRLYIEAVTAETRGLQSRAGDPADGDIAAKIMRALTAIVSEHRPGHVYGLARHHQADWEDIARRARAEIRTFPGEGAKPSETAAEN